MSWMPASSSTARTPPPAITPVPGDAGLSSTRPEPNTPVVWWVIVLPCLGTLKRSFFARSTPFWIASGTRWPCRSDADDFAFVAHDDEGREREAAAPDDLATRLISTTRSWRSRPAWFIERLWKLT